MKTVIEMAGQAFETPGTEPAFRNGFWTVTQEELERFAALVRADERARMAEHPAPVHDLRWLELLRKNKTATDEVIGAFLRGHAEYLTGEAFVIKEKNNG